MAKKSRTRQARQRRRQQRRQNRRQLLLIAIVLVAVVAVAMVIVSNQPVDTFIPQELSQHYEGIQRSYSQEGYPRLGDPDAPVIVEEYSSFACPGCEAFHSDSLDQILERVREGQILFSYVPLQTGSIPNAPGASQAALCAGQQGMFWEMHDVLFDWQTRYGNTAFSQNRLLSGVESLGLNRTAFTNCFNSADIMETLSAAQNEDVTTTPTIRVNGVTIESEGIPSAASILQAIDAATPANWWNRDTEPSLQEESPQDTDAEEIATDAAEESTDQVEAESADAESAAGAEPEDDEPSPNDDAAAKSTETSVDEPADSDTNTVEDEQSDSDDRTAEEASADTEETDSG